MVGIKPTVGLVSRDSVVPISTAQDTLGPIARTVRDAAAMLSVMAGRDPNDDKTDSIPFEEIPDYRAACDRGDLSKYHLGVPRNAMKDILPEDLRTFEDVLEHLRGRVAKVIDCELTGMSKFEAMVGDEKTNFIAAEFHESLDKYLANLATNPGRISNLAGLCEYVKTTKEEEFPDRLIDRFEQALALSRDSAEYRNAKEATLFFGGEGGIPGALDRHALYAILVPTEAWAANYFTACGGQPQITIPAGFLAEGTEVKMNDTGRLVEQGPNVP